MKRQALVLGALLAAACSHPVTPAPGAPTSSSRTHAGGSVTGIDHVSFVVTRLDAARSFYGDLLGLDEVDSQHAGRGTASVRTAFLVGRRQWIELEVGAAGPDGRLGHVAFTALGLPAGRWTSMQDPDGHRLEIFGSPRSPVATLASDAVASSGAAAVPAYLRLVHVGVLVGSLDAALGFYRGRLGFQEFWRGGSNDRQLDWVNLRTPAGEDYVELMLYRDLPGPEARGGKNHACIFVADVRAAVAAIEARPARKSYSRPIEIKVGRNHKRQVNLFDPDGTRIELMEPQTIDGQPVPPSTAPPPRP